MEPKLQRRVQRYGWDKAASFYEQSWARALEPAQTRLLELAGLKPGEHVLDVACGTGLVAFRAAAAVAPDGEVVGAEISQGMLDEATRIAAERGIDNVSFSRIESDEIALGAAFLGGAVALAYAKFDDETREAVHAEYLASIAPYRQGDGYGVPAEFVVAMGRKR